MLVIDVGIQVVKQNGSAIAKRATDQGFDVSDLGGEILYWHNACAQGVSRALVGRLLVGLDEMRNGRRVTVTHFFEVNDRIMVAIHILDVGVGLNGAGVVGSVNDGIDAKQGKFAVIKTYVRVDF